MIPTEIGNNVTIGHGATLLGVTLGDETLIGMGSTLLQGVEVRFQQAVPLMFCRHHTAWNFAPGCASKYVELRLSGMFKHQLPLCFTQLVSLTSP